MVTYPLNDFASLDWWKFSCLMYLSHSPLEAKDFQFKSTRRVLSTQAKVDKTRKLLTLGIGSARLLNQCFALKMISKELSVEFLIFHHLR